MNITLDTYTMLPELTNDSTSNTTSLPLPLGPPAALLAVTTIGGVVGTMAIILNVLLLVYTVRVHKRKPTSFTFQTIFVLIDDCMCGVLLFIMSFLRVSHISEAIVCAATMIFLVSVHLISKGNIFCICLQRYRFALNINKVVPTWRNIHTVTLLLVNILTGFSFSTFFVLDFKFITSYGPGSRLCSPVTVFVLENNDGYTATFFIGTLLIIFSDIICGLTLHTLWKIPSEIGPAPTTDTERVNLTSPFAAARSRHRHAIVTILIMLVFYTLTYVPIATSQILAMNGIFLQPSVQRLGLIIGFLPSVINPALIATRTHNIRYLFRTDLDGIRSTIAQKFTSTQDGISSPRMASP